MKSCAHVKSLCFSQGSESSEALQVQSSAGLLQSPLNPDLRTSKTALVLLGEAAIFSQSVSSTFYLYFFIRVSRLLI